MREYREGYFADQFGGFCVKRQHFSRLSFTIDKKMRECINTEILVELAVKIVENCY
jgi:hypothetical protein